MAKRLGTNKETFHEIIKKDIKKAFKNVLEARNIKNPDIGLDGLGNIVLKDLRTGMTILTDVPLTNFTIK